MQVNGNPMALYVIGGVFAAVILWVALYFIFRTMKGSMKIVTAKTNFSSGEAITGTLTVSTKKPIDADRMYIALIGEREVRRRSSSGSGSSRSWDEFYRDEADIMMDEHLRAGFSETYDFTLDAPDVPQIEDQIKSFADNTDNEIAKTIAKGVGQLASLGTALGGGRKRWKVISRLETKGVDLAASRNIHVSLKGLV